MTGIGYDLILNRRAADIDETEPGPKINLHDALLVWLPKNTGRHQGLGESDGI